MLVVVMLGNHVQVSMWRFEDMMGLLKRAVVWSIHCSVFLMRFKTMSTLLFLSFEVIVLPLPTRINLAVSIQSICAFSVALLNLPIVSFSLVAYCKAILQFYTKLSRPVSKTFWLRHQIQPTFTSMPQKLATHL